MPQENNPRLDAKPSNFIFPVEETKDEDAMLLDVLEFQNPNDGKHASADLKSIRQIKDPGQLNSN